MNATTLPPAPFEISVQNPSEQLREMHLSFTSEFQAMPVEQRATSMRTYVDAMVQQSKLPDNDEGTQRGLMIVIELSEQLLPHIQSGSMPLQETLIVKMGEGSDGSSLDELLS